MTKMKRRRRARALAATLRSTGSGPIPSDVQGSYKGCGNDDPKPVQDADDL